MKKTCTFILMLAVCLMAAAQSKLTPQAQLKVEKGQRAAVKAQTRAKAKGKAAKEATIRLMVKVQDGAEAEAVRQMQACGARVEGVLGQQVLIALPVDSVASLSRIEGITRIGTGTKGQKKTINTRKETGVSLLNNASSVGSDQSADLTGKGVTILLIDEGFDYQHPAFKRADGTSRIKCVYRMNNEDGNPFSYTLSDEGLDMTIELPGSVYDTPELIASLTTDEKLESHGTHTTGIAAGSFSPDGFAGMAPEADIVLVPFSEMGEDDKTEEEMDAEDAVAMALNFAAAYAQQSEQPVVLSASLNSHMGSHDGTSSMAEAVEDVSQYLIPVFSCGNEGEDNCYLHHDFNGENDVMMTGLSGLYGGMYGFEALNYVSGFLRDAQQVSVSLCIPYQTDEDDEEGGLWQSPTLTVSLDDLDDDDDPQMLLISSEEDDELAQLFDGEVGIAVGLADEGRLSFEVVTDGDMADHTPFILSVEANDGAQLDMWNSTAGFDSFGEPLLEDGCNDISGGDWTSGESVISVGAYSAVDDEWLRLTAGDIASFSSYGTMPNGVVQPVVCAPGTRVISAVSHYLYGFGDEAYAEYKWDGYPYFAMDGTSMACPAVSGIVALWLQLCPGLTLQQVREVMQHSSVNDDFTAADPIRWGYGKINAKLGADYIQENFNTAIKTVSNWDSDRSNAVYDLQGRKLSNGHTAKGLYIVNGKKVIL